MVQSSQKIAIITGASAGIGLSTAQVLAENGYEVILGARRLEKFDAVKSEFAQKSFLKPHCLHLDVTDDASCKKFCEQALEICAGRPILLVNNAGLAVKTDHVSAGHIDDWELMLQTNVLGVLRITRNILPTMIASDAGHIVNIGSVAGHYVYEGGSVYTASKHALRAITKTLRLELNGKKIRVSSIDPGMVETEFSVVRLQDAERAKKVYQGMTPLSPRDIAETVYYVASRPAHVNIDEIILMPLDQASVSKVHRV